MTEPVPGTPAWRELADARRAIIQSKLPTAAQQAVLQKEDDRIAMMANRPAGRPCRPPTPGVTWLP